MNAFSCVPAQQSGATSPAHWLRIILVLAPLGLAGCNDSQAVSPSSPTRSQVFAGHSVETNPYNPISYAQNNTGRGGR